MLNDMKKILFMSILILLIIPSSGFAWEAELEIEHGRLALLDGRFSVTVSGTVKGVKSNEFDGKREPSRTISGAWLGVTAIINGEEIDFPVRHVNGRIKEKFSVSIEKLASSGGGEIIWIAKLWEGKINSNTCKLNGSACSYCKKNGYHMMGMLSSATENKMF